MKSGTASIQVLSNNNTSKKLNRNNYTGSPVTDTLTNGFFTVDRQWTVQYWNKAAEKLLGVLSADIVGKNVWQQFADVLPLEFYTVYQSAFLQNRPVHFEEYWGQMGAWFDVVIYHCDDTLSVSFKSSNKPHAEYPENPYQRLKVLTELYKFVTEITNDCLWEWDVQHKEIFWIDGGHKRVLGYPIENALVPQYFWESCIHPEDKKRVLDKLSRIIADGDTDTWEDEYRFKKANGEYAYVCDRGHIVYQEGTVSRIIGATQDNTEKVLLENKLSAQREANLAVITNAAFSAQEKEKGIIGMELHENVNQVLAIIKMNLQMAKTVNNKKDIYIDKSAELIDTVIKDIRLLTRRIVIPDIEFIGLFDNVRNLIADLSEGNTCDIAFYTKDIAESAISENLQINIYRIIQEQLNSILMYKKTACIDIALYKNEATIVLLVSDNEEAGDNNITKRENGSINILNRAQLCNGTVSTISTPGEGYLLKITFPLSAQC